jgi:hypothetical protein
MSAELAHEVPVKNVIAVGSMIEFRVRFLKERQINASSPRGL